MFREVVISGTPKPGTMMQFKVGTALDGGNRETWEVYNPGADGSPQVLAILTEEGPHGNLGRDYDTAFASGDRGMLYFPEPGDELNVRRSEITGTGSPSEDISVGEKLLIVSGTGFVSPVAIGVAASPTYKPFRAMEAISDPGMTPGGVTVATAHALVHVTVDGPGAQ
jgi:hypothetical protein